jgi:hypothetical protein
MLLYEFREFGRKCIIAFPLAITRMRNKLTKVRSDDMK